MKSKAAILFEVGQELKIHEVDVQAPQAGEALVRIVAAGICHSDLHAMTGHLVVALPAILGHEGAGIVEQVGRGVTSLKPGDHVIPLLRIACGRGTCEYCSDARPNLCPEATQMRMTGHLMDGTTRFQFNGKEIKHFSSVSSFSEYTVIPEQGLLKIPSAFPLDKAALLGCGVTAGVGAVFNCAHVKPGSSVAVFGAGGIGLNVIQGAVIAGAEKIIAVDIIPKKLEHAKKFGATHAINGSDGKAAEQIKSLTNGGVEYAFEAIGQPATLRQAHDSLRKRGMTIAIGVTPMTMEVSIPIMSLVYEEKVLTGSLYGSCRPKIDIPKLIALYERGKLKLDELLTHRYPFSQINEAFEALKRGEMARSIVTF